MDKNLQKHVTASIETIKRQGKFRLLKKDLVNKSNLPMQDGLFDTGGEPEVFDSFAQLEDHMA